MTESRLCPQCGAKIPLGAPAGQCPQCLIKAGFESEVSFKPGLEATAASPASSRFEPPTVEKLAPLFPQLEILELLGKGGMGAVYKARQPGLDRLVAIKILPPEISRDPAFAERFQREARALARLSHPRIVAVYDFGQTAAPLKHVGSGAGVDGSLCYFVMEFVDGANLRQTIQTGALTPLEALAIVPQICEALQFAHDEGIVHRDIKPENILIDKRGRVKIADFGLAKLLGQDATDHSLTATQQVMGTLRYMAPEQMQGSREVDHRADIYSLGVVFYELLTGELPMGRFAAPSTRVQVDVRLDEIVLRALEQQPARRYQHASEIKTDVENLKQPTLAVSNEPRFSRFAIAGAVWALFGLSAVIPTLFFVGLNRVWNGTALPTNIIYEQPPLAFTIFMGALLAIGAGAPIGTTIFGAIAIQHIKRSDGRIIGLSLAVADALLFPTLLVDWLILVLAPSTLANLSQGTWSGGLRQLTLLIGIPLCAWINFMIARGLWRAVTGHREAPRKEEAEGKIPSEWEVAVQTWWFAQSNVARKVLWIALNAFCAFCIFAFFSFKGFSDTDHNAHFQIGLFDPWLVYESNQGSGKRSVSGIFLAWSWLFGIGAYGSGCLLFKLKSVPRKSPLYAPSSRQDVTEVHGTFGGEAIRSTNVLSSSASPAAVDHLNHFLGFIMTPQPGYARQVGVPMIIVTGLWMLAMLVVLIFIPEENETARLIGMGAGLLLLPLGILLLSLRWAVLRGKAVEASRSVNPSNGIGSISLWTAIAGVVLPALLALGAQMMASSQRLSDFFVLCVALGALLELVAFGCGLVARRTGDI